jgi:hypothetical protein
MFPARSVTGAISLRRRPGTVRKHHRVTRVTRLKSLADCPEIAGLPDQVCLPCYRPGQGAFPDAFLYQGHY